MINDADTSHQCKPHETTTCPECGSYDADVIDGKIACSDCYSDAELENIDRYWAG